MLSALLAGNLGSPRTSRHNGRLPRITADYAGRSPAFSPVEALQSLHLDAVDLDALAEAASHAVGELGTPADWPSADREARFASERF
jgi:hypothetical protein